MNVALICARAGSKGLPGKNTREMCGVPLLAFAIAKAEDAKLVDDVVVCTDIDLVNYPGKTIERPIELAGDRASKWDVWRHAAKEYEAQTGTRPDTITDIDVSRPLTISADVDRIIRLFPQLDVQAAMAICPAKTNPWFDIVAPDKDGGSLRPIGGKHYTARQDAPPAFQHGGIYVVDVEALLANEKMWALKWSGIEIPRQRTFDIDDLLDWEIVEWIMEQRQTNPDLFGEDRDAWIERGGRMAEV